jgi:hypothetical protein
LILILFDPDQLIGGETERLGLLNQRFQQGGRQLPGPGQNPQIIALGPLITIQECCLWSSATMCWTP